MTLAKRYDFQEAEARLASQWEKERVFAFSLDDDRPVYSIDTPPPTVSGNLHLGHVYSYSHADFIARFQRMNGQNVFYRMGYDDNGLPTERLVEQRLGKTAREIGREAFVQQCLRLGEEVEAGYGEVFRRLGLSIDWTDTYRTIGPDSRRVSQLSFIQLFRKDLAYRQEAPTIWCPECRTAIAQAEVNDLDQASQFVTVAFGLEDGRELPVATTRPELLPACVAIFVHPEDARYRGLVGRKASVPIFGQTVPIQADPQADPAKGTGAVMCCTFGDATDVQWWRNHQLPLRETIRRDGSLGERAGELAGLSTAEARKRITQTLEQRGLLLVVEPVTHSIRVHERCDTPVEYIVTKQWFIRVLDHKEELFSAGDQVNWFPSHMKTRYRAWVENLHWDWAISRQRYFGVHFPVWYCDACGEVVLADESQLPVDPTRDKPLHGCQCGVNAPLTPEEDVMDTWVTSSMSPQIIGRWLAQPELYERVFPMTLRPQAHDIIRTWAFDTIVKSCYQFGTVPWRDALISGFTLAPKGSGKISKSRGGGPMAPMELLDGYSADAVRYWAASTGPGKDSTVSDEKMQAGAKLVTKLWNVAALSSRFLEGYESPSNLPLLRPTDRWILSGLQRLVIRATDAFGMYDYTDAKNETEGFFWRDLADNYLEMAKKRLYDPGSPGHDAAKYTLHRVVLTILKLFAPVIPFVTDEIYRMLFITDAGSIHLAEWPVADGQLVDQSAEEVGDLLLLLATAVRSYKTEQNLSLSAELRNLQISFPKLDSLRQELQEAEEDISSVTRALKIQLTKQLDPGLQRVEGGEGLVLALRV